MSAAPRSWQPGDPLLAGKVALVVGGGRGIGAATATMLGAAGASVAVLDVEGDRAAETVDALARRGLTARPVVADVGVEDECRRAVDAVVEDLGGVDVLANVVGGMTGQAEWRHLEHWSTDEWDRVVHLNLRYVFWMARAVLPVMRARGGGSIVNVTSISGVFGAPNHSAYGAAKAGLIHLTKTLAVEYGRDGIRVNAVSPGAVATPATESTMSAERRATLAAATPLQRPGQPEDVARAVLYFASPMSDYVTGQMLLVDGGVGAKFPLGGVGTHVSEAALPTG